MINYREQINNLTEEERQAMIEKEYDLVKETDEAVIRQQLHLHKKEDETEDRAIGRAALRPEITASIALCKLHNNQFAGGGLDINGLVDELNYQMEQIKKGDLSRAEGMLVAQALTLGTIFSELVCRAAANMGSYLETTETYFKMALKAQSQCRSTWEAVSKIQNPPQTFNQTNVAHNQQVNNSPNQLAGGNDELSSNRGNETASGQADSSMEAMGKVDRAENTGG